MKRIMPGLLAVSLFGFAACDDGEGKMTDQPAPSVQAPADAKPAAAAPAEAPKPPEPTATEICTQLAAAAKANDEGKVATFIAAGMEPIAAEGVKEPFLATFAAATCGEAKIEGEKADKATIPLIVGADPKTATTKEALFIKTAEGWKLDGAAYAAKNPADKAKKGKKAKKAKGKKAKA